jgi:hypothetical protein
MSQHGDELNRLRKEAGRVTRLKYGVIRAMTAVELRREIAKATDKEQYASKPDIPYDDEWVVNVFDENGDYLNPLAELQGVSWAYGVQWANVKFNEHADKQLRIVFMRVM